jgi:hypothetical protein
MPGLPRRLETPGFAVADGEHDRESQAAVQHHVDLLVPSGRLIVVADHLDADVGRAIDVDTESRQLEVVLNRARGSSRSS